MSKKYMGSKKFCPLQNWDETTIPRDSYCKRERCAWWNSDYNMCNVTIEGHIAGVKWSASE